MEESDGNASVLGGLTSEHTSGSAFDTSLGAWKDAILVLFAGSVYDPALLCFCRVPCTPPVESVLLSPFLLRNAVDGAKDLGHATSKFCNEILDKTAKKA